MSAMYPSNVLQLLFRLSINQLSGSKEPQLEVWVGVVEGFSLQKSASRVAPVGWTAEGKRVVQQLGGWASRKKVVNVSSEIYWPTVFWGLIIES